MPVTPAIAMTVLALLANGPQDVNVQRSRLQEPVAGLSYQVGRTSHEIKFFASPDFRRPLGFPKYETFYVAQRTIHFEREIEVVWADSDTCPSLVGVLSWLDQLQPGDLAVPGMSTPLPDGVVGRPPPRARLDDGRRRYTVWSVGWDANGDLVNLSASGSSQILAAFGDAAIERLDPCWTAAQPTIPTQS